MTEDGVHEDGVERRVRKRERGHVSGFETGCADTELSSSRAGCLHLTALDVDADQLAGRDRLRESQADGARSAAAVENDASPDADGEEGSRRSARRSGSP